VARRLRIGIALVTATVVVGALGGFSASARAGLLSCSGGTQVFAQWGDNSYYYPATNGGLEFGSYGWSLGGGAAVVSGNEPFYASGSHSLSLPSGSTATSPATCVGLLNDEIRMFGSDLGGTDGGLRVRVVWYGLLSNVLGITDVGTLAPGGGWYPTDTIRSLGGLPPLLPLLGSTSARVQFTPIGAGSNWRIDDLFVDPYYCR
jgi:hypothetical protein